MKGTGQRWKEFLCVLGDPWVIVFALTTAGLIIYSGRDHGGTQEALSTTMLIVASAILGGRVARVWTDISESSALVARGRLAVRGLKLLLGDLVYVDRRIQLHLMRRKRSLAEPKQMRLLLEEVRGRCAAMSEEAVSSIENWTDILPEADVRSQIGIISDLVGKLDAAQHEVKRVSAALAGKEAEAAGERERLTSELEEKEAEVARLRKDLLYRQVNLGTGQYASPQFDIDSKYGPSISSLTSLLSSGTWVPDSSGTEDSGWDGDDDDPTMKFDPEDDDE